MKISAAVVDLGVEPSRSRWLFYLLRLFYNVFSMFYSRHLVPIVTVCNQDICMVV